MFANVLLIVNCAAAQSGTIDSKLAARYFQQLRQTSNRDDGKTWGLPLYRPIMFVDPTATSSRIKQISTIYPTLRVVDAWGVLTVTSGAWLERDATGHVVRARVAAPADLSTRPLKGDGWSLDLANGWEVVPGDRRGDVKLAKRP